LLAFNLIFNACRQEENWRQDQNPDQVFFSKFNFNGKLSNISGYDELNQLVENLLNDGTKITSTELRKSDDGTFYYLYSKGRRGDVLSTVGIPLDFDPNGSVFSANGSGCTHRCDQAAFNPCTTCDLTIHERCKRQSCSCKTGDGSCDGAIAFPSESPK